MLISMDFDDTIRMEDGTLNEAIVKLIHQYTADGHECIIVTARNKTFFHITGVEGYIQKHGLPIKACHFTNHELKGSLLKKLKVDRHYDDKVDHLDSALRHGIEAYHVVGENITIYTELSYDRMMKKIYDI